MNWSVTFTLILALFWSPPAPDEKISLFNSEMLDPAEKNADDGHEIDPEQCGPLGQLEHKA